MLVRRVIASVRGITKFPERKINIEKILCLNCFLHCEYAIIWYKQQNPLGHCSENQGSAEAKFKIIKVQNYKRPLQWRIPYTTGHRKHAMLKFNCQIILMTSVSGRTSRHTITMNTFAFKEYNEILFIAPQHG